MESSSTHQVAAGKAGGSSPTVITVPRWLEVRDRRPGAERFDPSRSRYYVVSPHLSPHDASALAHAYTQRERLERAHQALEVVQTPILIASIALLVYLVAIEASYWSLVVPALMVVVVQYMYHDASNDLRKPLDIVALEEQADSRMFHRIQVGEFQQADRVAKNDQSKGAEAHQLMWRAYELTALYMKTQEDFQHLSASGVLSSKEVHAISTKLLALQELVRDAHTALASVLNPKRRVLPQGRDGLLELVRRVDEALKEGMDLLEPRIDEINEKVSRARQARVEKSGSQKNAVVSAHSDETSSAGIAPTTPHVGASDAQSVGDFGLATSSALLDLPTLASNDGNDAEQALVQTNFVTAHMLESTAGLGVDRAEQLLKEFNESAVRNSKPLSVNERSET